MILLDTNVVSELMKPQPDEGVVPWLAAQPREELSTTAITKAEVLYGVARLPDGQRKSALAAEAERMFRDDFAGRILAFDDAAAPHYAEILGEQRRAGRPMTTLDAQIAAIALVRGAAVATRNVGDFEGCGVETADPWTVG